jgi:FixJ family two-component response regulator
VTNIYVFSTQPKYIEPELVWRVFLQVYMCAIRTHGGRIESTRMICTIVSIVDDDRLVRDATVDLLNSLGYTALGFESAEKFLDSGEVKNTGCLITDQQLPGLSGTELQKYLCGEGYRTPVIFITGFPEPIVRERAIGAGAIAFLTKPFEEAALVNSLQTALSAH